MWALFGAVGVLLLIACANVSGLMLTRVSLRNHDDAIRLAIGGSRTAIGRLWAAETVWLIVVGGALGLLTCQWFIAAIVALAPEGIPRLDEVAIDLPVAVFSDRGHGARHVACAARRRFDTPASINLVETLNDGSRTVARRPFVSHAIVAAGGADRPGRRAARGGRPRGPQLHRAADTSTSASSARACCALKVEPREDVAARQCLDRRPAAARSPRCLASRRPAACISRRSNSGRSVTACGRSPRASAEIAGDGEP